MHHVDMYIETGIRGPARRTSKAMWRMVCNGTMRDGLVTVIDATESRLCLAAIVDAGWHLSKPCHLLIHIRANSVFHTINNGWIYQWKKNGWKNAKGKLTANADLWEKLLWILSKHEWEVTADPNPWETVMRGVLKDWEE